MRFKIQLNGIKDLDLLSLYYNRQFRFPEEVKRTLCAYVSNNDYSVLLPDHMKETIVPFTPVQINISLDDREDKDVIFFLQKIKKGYRSAAVKSIFRNYLQRPAIDVFLISGSEIILRKEKGHIEPQKEHKEVEKQKPLTTTIQPDENTEDEFDIFSGDFIKNY